MFFNTIRKILSDILLSEEDYITPDSKLISDLGLNEIDLLDFALEIDNAFDVMISDEELDAFETVADVVKYIENHR